MEQVKKVISSKNLIEYFFYGLFLLPVYPDNLKPTVLVLFLLISIFSFFNNKFHQLKIDKKLVKGFFINSSIFFILLLSLLYSENVKEGSKYIFRSLPILILPLSFLLLSKERFLFEKTVLEKAKLCFYFSTLLFCICVFLYFYFSGFVTENFVLNYSHRISFQLGKFSIHPIYASIYILISLILSLSFLTKKKYRMLIIIGNLLLIINLFLLARKSAILILCFVFGLYFFFKIKKRYKFKILLIFCSITFLLLLIKYAPEVTSRFNDFKYLFTGDYNSSNIRINIYMASLEVIKENFFFGCGIGDVKDVLLSQESKFDILRGKYYNTHNQFLNYTVSNGIIGLGVFLFMTFKNLKLSLKNNFEHFSILLTFCFLMFIENILDRQNGVILFSIFLNYYFFKVIIRENEEKDINDRAIP